jgi:hypothetical protein
MRKSRTAFAIPMLVALACFGLLARSGNAQQMADPDFDARVSHPAYTAEHPKIIIDEAHRNFHTASGRYKPFADLLRNDGYDVKPGTVPFSANSLAGATVLVVANALGSDSNNDTSSPAFTEAESDAIQDWVRGGGSLLLIADHTPFGAAAQSLARRFGVELGLGFVFDTPRFTLPGGPATLVFSRENGLLGDDSILKGRTPAEEVDKVVSFAGESLSIPPQAIVLMRLGPTAREVPNRAALVSSVDPNAAQVAAAQRSTSAAGLAQGLALKFGQGRVAVFGEAAMFSAQVLRFEQGGRQREIKAGMNAPGNDDRQLLLNVMHWLSRLLP